MRMCRPVVLALLLLAGVGPLATTALAESFCYVTEVKHEAVSNAIQVTVKADGILKGEWAGGGDWYAENRRQLIGVRFTNARMKLDEWMGSGLLQEKAVAQISAVTAKPDATLEELQALVVRCEEYKAKLDAKAQGGAA